MYMYMYVHIYIAIHKNYENCVHLENLDVQCIYCIGPFLRETVFVDFGTILENKSHELHGGYGQWPSEIGNP